MKWVYNNDSKIRLPLQEKRIVWVWPQAAVAAMAATKPPPRKAMKTNLLPSLPHSPYPAPSTAATRPDDLDCGMELLATALHRHWPFLKAMLKEHYLVLTDDDLSYSEGREEEFLDHLERKTCRARREFAELILAESGHLP